MSGVDPQPWRDREPDRTAQQTAVSRAADLAFATCRRVLGNDQDAADCAQDVLVRWWQQRHRIRVSPLGWIQAAAHGAAVDMIRRREARRRREAAVEPPRDPATADEQAARSLAVDACLAELPDKERALLIEHHLAGVAQSELARRLRCSQPTIHRSLQRAAEHLGKLLRRRGIALPALTLAGLIAGRAEAAAPPTVRAVLTGGAGAALLAPPVLGWWAAHAAAVVLATLATTLTVTVSWAGWWYHTRTQEAAAAQIALYQSIDVELRARGVTPPIGLKRPRHWSIAALVATLPPVDEALQERWREWQAQVQPFPHEIENLHLTSPWLLNPKLPKPAEFDRHLTEALEVIAPAQSMLRDRQLVLGLAGWMARDFREGKMERLQQWFAAHINGGAWGGSLLLYRNMAHVFAMAALTSADPEPYLDDLDELVWANQRATPMLIDAMVAIAVSSIRDETYLLAIRMGRLSEVRFRTWLAEESRLSARVSEGFWGEVMISLIPMAEEFGVNNLDWPDGIPIPDDSVITRAWNMLGMSVLSPWAKRDLFRSADLLSELSRSCAGRRNLPRAESNAFIQEGKDGKIFPIAAIVVPNLFLECPQVFVEATASHRLRRLCALLYNDVNQGKPLPETLTLPPPTYDGYSLRYRKLAVDRFELCADPDAAEPDLAALGRLRDNASRWRKERTQKSPAFIEDRLHYDVVIPPKVRPTAPTIPPDLPHQLDAKG